MWGSTHFVGYLVWKKGGSRATSGSKFRPRGPRGVAGVKVEVPRSWAGHRSPGGGNRPGLAGPSRAVLPAAWHINSPLPRHRISRGRNEERPSVDTLSTELNTLSQSDLKSKISDLGSGHLLTDGTGWLEGTSRCFAFPRCVYFSEVFVCWTRGVESVW